MGCTSAATDGEGAQCGGSNLADCPKPAPQLAPASAPEAGSDIATVKHVKLYIDPLRSGGDLNASVDLELARSADADRLYLHGKATCLDHGRRLVSFDQTGVDRLDRMGLRLFSDGGFEPSNCEVHLRLSGREGAVWAPLPTFCFADGKSAPGPCPEFAASPSPRPAAAQRLTIAAVSVEFDEGLVLQHDVAIHDDIGYSFELTVRTACRLGDLNVVEIDATTIDAGAFSFDAGDVLPMRSQLFDDERFDPQELEATTCEVRFLAKVTGQTEPEPLDSVCIEQGVVAQGSCTKVDFSPVDSTPQADPKSDQALTVLNPRAELFASPGDDAPNATAVRFDLDVLARRRLAGDPTVRAAVRCMVGAKLWNAERPTQLGTDPEDLRVGEVSRLQVEGFRYDALPSRPSWCELSLAERFEDAGPAYAAVCWRPSATTTGPCK